MVSATGTANDPPVIILGGGLAGLFCALQLAPMPVTVLTAAPIGEGASTAWAQGGIAAAVGDGDTPEQHARDTIAAGAGLVDEGVALRVAREAPDRIRDLLRYGVPFDKDLEGRLLLSREAAHSARRIVRVRGDMAGRAIIAALVTAVRNTPSITVREGFIGEELLLLDGHVRGVLARGDYGRAAAPEAFRARAVVLATGGIGHLYRVTTNPPEARGAGLALAAHAGAVLADPEFVQFHPTAIDIGRDPAPLATEALRGEGALLVDRDGNRFMAALHPDAELAPRDVVARGVFASLQEGRGAFLDARPVGAEFAERFPTVYAICRDAGIDPAAQPIPVCPAEHYHMGGVWTDMRGRTSLPGLFAVGEVASTGVHGANRLASNSLLEAVVFAARVAADLKGESAGSPAIPRVLRAARPCLPSAADAPLLADLRATMAREFGVVRHDAGMRAGIARIRDIERRAESTMLSAMASAALIIAVAAWQRTESRGGHFRADHPATSPDQARRTMITEVKAREIATRLASAETRRTRITH